MEEPEVWKAGVHAFIQNGINFYCAGFDLGEAAHFMEPGEWVLISPQREVKFFCAQGDPEAVKQAFIDQGGVIEKVYQVIDNKIQWPPIVMENCPHCGKQKPVGQECSYLFWGRPLPGEEKEPEVPPDKKPFA